MSSQHEDMISSLPDHIICHILSFLPTKFAVTTSILSKRWNPLWRLVFTLYFDNKTFKDFTSFRNFVSSIFHSRDIMLPLHTFHLKWSKASNLNSHDIHQFVDTAVQCGGIKNLNLEISDSSNDFKFTLPLTIFSCRTLVVLQLKGVEMSDLTQLVVDFLLLKTLYISSVSFKRADCLVKLLLGCPILEDLQAEYLLSENMDLTSTLKGKYPGLPNLIRAYITNSSFSLRFLIILVCGAKVQVLRVEIDTLFYNNYTFNNLAYMELILNYNHCESENWKPLREVLERCPNLQNLTINKDSWNGKEAGDNYWKDPTIISKCFLTRLRTCSLNDYKCTESELQFARYIMQNSKVLNTMSIKSASSIDKNIKDEMVTKLSSLTTASTSCKLLFD